MKCTFCPGMIRLLARPRMLAAMRRIRSFIFKTAKNESLFCELFFVLKKGLG